MGYTNEKCPIAFVYAKTVPTLINGKKKYENMNASTRKLYREGCICLLYVIKTGDYINGKLCGRWFRCVGFADYTLSRRASQSNLLIISYIIQMQYY